ncbi:MAG: phosphoglucosamine mutase [Proteobacteria bacterium]|nr:phosphoglucosamine mutase [Cystobacterineae bacterium]MCL2258727.1 phosphoglucosamine mutase [Cystobacterineae bacterium]MCL2314901.1 phosphoglucosamine mutase [Pseudomonadota bacterium]
MARKLFGTDGVRGKANTQPMTVDLAMQLGCALAHFVQNGGHRHKIVIGKDTRLSCYMLEQALAAGMMSMGVDVAFLGPLPTPGIANITTSMRADAGAVISASHNRFDDNGIKFFSRDGFKLPDETEEKIEQWLEQDYARCQRPSGAHIGRAVRWEDARGRYIVSLKNTFPRELTLEGMKLVVDCANGAAYRVTPEVLEELGAQVVRLNVSPNGVNINSNCGALYPQKLQEAVVQEGANLGIALDGDADRLVLVDEKGRLVDGDAIMAVCAREWSLQKNLHAQTLVATVMSNIGLEQALATFGAKVVRTQVGDRYVVEHMRRCGLNMGGEQSGHIVFLDYAPTGDGTLAALQILAILCRQQKPLSELASFFQPSPQVLRNLEVSMRVDLKTLPEVQTKIQSVEAALGKEGRVFIRFSGTEPKVRVLVEGPDEAKVQEYADDIVHVLKKNLSKEGG